MGGTAPHAEPLRLGSRTSELERQLQETEAKYRALVENIPAVLYINLCDEADTTVYVSPQTRSILGIPPEAWYANDGNWNRYVHPEDRERVVDKYQTFVRSHMEGVDEYRFVRPDGSVIWLHDRLSVVRDPGGTPLFIQGVIFDISERKAAEEIAHRQVELLEKVDTISRDFTDLVVKEASPRQILARLASIVENPIVLENAAHQLLEFAPFRLAVDEVVDEWDRHSRIGHSYDDPRTPRIEDTNPPCAWMPIWIRRELWGAVHMLAIDSPIEDIDLLAVDRTAAAIGLSLLSEPDTANLVDIARGAVIFEILRERLDVQDVLRHAKRLGIRLDGCRLAALVVKAADVGGAEEPRGLSERERQRIQAASMKGVQEALAEAGYPALSAPDGSTILIVVGLPQTEPVRARLDRLAHAIIRRISVRVPGLSIAVGASQEARPETLRSALEDAGEAASYAVQLGEDGVQHFGDLGVLHLLMELAGSPELARFVEAELGPLLERDARGASIWISTLRTYLDAGRKKVLAADRLHIDRRTLYYRLERIQRLLGRDLDDHDVCLRLEVALRSLDLLKGMRSRSGRGGPWAPDQAGAEP